MTVSNELARRPAFYTVEESEVGNLYYFAASERAAGPYCEQRHVPAIVDIDSDGRFAGVELIDRMPPPPPPELERRTSQPVAWLSFVDGEPQLTGDEAALLELKRSGPGPYALFASPPSQGEQVAVKGLEWGECAINRWGGFDIPASHGLAVAYAKTPIGTYAIVKGSQGRFEAWLRDEQVSGAYDAKGEAKAAAQADYEQRIRSALTSPAPSLVVSDAPSMWAKVVPDDETGKLVWECKEADGRGEISTHETVELAANTFPAGTTLTIVDPSALSARIDEAEGGSPYVIEIKRLTKEREHLRNSRDQLHVECSGHIAARAAAERLLAETTGALEPLVAYINARDAHDEDMPDDLVAVAYAPNLREDSVRITLGDLRLARTTLSNIRGHND